jgi:hypothetical protein
MRSKYVQVNFLNDIWHRWKHYQVRFTSTVTIIGVVNLTLFDLSASRNYRKRVLEYLSGTYPSYYCFTHCPRFGVNRCSLLRILVLTVGVDAIEICAGQLLERDLTS